MNLTTTTDKVRKETTVTATTANGTYLYSETWAGLGARVAVTLGAEVRKQAEQYERRLLVASGTTTTETRLLAGRV
jgi:hypothetical protein